MLSCFKNGMEQEERKKKKKKKKKCGSWLHSVQVQLETC